LESPPQGRQIVAFRALLWTCRALYLPGLESAAWGYVDVYVAVVIDSVIDSDIDADLDIDVVERARLIDYKFIGINLFYSF
jgi:hypothetical protein